MRWFWIDRFTEFVSGERATAVRAVTQGEEQINSYVPGFGHMPMSLIVEGLAQTGGLLVAQHGDFHERVVLAKLGKATFHTFARTGDVLTYKVEIQSISQSGAVVEGKSFRGDELQAEVNLVFAHLDDRFPDSLFDTYDFFCMIRAMGLFRLGVNPDGTPIKVPQHMLDAEEQAEGPLDPAVDSA